MNKDREMKFLSMDSVSQSILIKSRNASKWLVMRESAIDAPNFFLSYDLKKYRRLTDLQPQRNYNWITAELVNWKQFDGTISQGILYKPENFDSLKHYPILFTYYEKSSNTLFNYQIPRFLDGAAPEVAW